MSRHITFLCAVPMMLLCSAGPVRADAQADLAAGRDALNAGDLDKALPLLTSAAQNLPDSVEAQAALGQAHLRAGQLEEALARYQAVLKLSPDHAQAKKIVAALTGKAATFQQRLAYAQALMDLNVHPLAQKALEKMVQEPAEAGLLRTARLMLAECKLWANSLPEAMADALLVVKEGPDAVPSAQARVIAALSLMGVGTAEPNPKDHVQQAADLLKGLAQLPAPWAARAEMASLWIQFEQDPTNAAAVSAKLAAPVASLPLSAFRDPTISRWTGKMVAQANRLLEKGDAAGAMAIVWPMVSDQPAPGPDAVLKPVAIKGGWLPDRPGIRPGRSQADVLSAIGRMEFARDRSKASLLGHWLAAQVLLAASPVETDAEKLLALTAELGGLSKPAPDRKTGQPLSRADEVQHDLILKLSERLTDPAQRQALVAMLSEQLARYDRAGDLETGLSLYVKVQDAPAADPKAAPKPPKVDLAGAFASWPPGAPQQQMLQVLAASFAQLGERAFRDAAATLDSAANTTLSKSDQIALVLLARQESLYPGAGQAGANAQRIFDRYAASSRWAVVEAAMAIFYADQPGDAAAWALAGLKIRQAAREEDKLLAARKKLAEKLHPAIVESLAAVAKLVGADPATPAAQAGSIALRNRQRAISLGDSLISRYHAADRADLAEGVISALTAPEAKGALDDWALWARANLLDRRAAIALAQQAREFDAAGKSAVKKLHDLHAAELKLLDQIVTQHPQSPYVEPVIDRLVQIATAYREYRAFDPAGAVLADFAKAHPKLAAVERLRYLAAVVAIARAQTAFAERKDKEKEKEKPPEKLSDEYAAAIDALSAFLKDYPSGEYAPSAGGELFQVAAVYGQTGAWGISRQVLGRFSAALPDFVSPQALRFHQAATYLGELDRAHGVQLLALPQRPTTRPAGHGGGRYGGWEMEPASGDKAGALTLTNGISKLALPTTPEGASTLVPGTAPRPGGTEGSTGGGQFIMSRALDSREALKLDDAEKPRADDLAIAAIRRGEQSKLQQLARMEEQKKNVQPADQQAGQTIALPSGPVLSEAEMKRQDAAADAAYAILIELLKDPKLIGEPLSEQARGQVLWMFGFFESQLRPDRAVTMIEKYLTDRPVDPARVDLSFRAIRDQFAYAGQVQPTDRIDQAWVDRRHDRFEQARKRIAAFLKEYADREDWVYSARMLAAESYQQEASLAASVSAVRSGGLLVQSAEELLAIARDMSQHPQVAEIPGRLWAIADRLEGLAQREQTMYVLGQIPIRFPMDGRAVQAVMRIGELYAANLNSPLRAMETFQEFLSLTGDNEAVRTRIFTIAQHLAAKQRYLEALHVYGVFVDSFPGDPRAPQALQAIGQTHQVNDAWNDAITAYRRIPTEYPGVAIIPQVQLAIAECQINLSDWKAARKSYEEFLQQYGSVPRPAEQPASQQPQAAPAGSEADLARRRIEILKSLDRYQTLLADEQVTRNKDDAQFQIGRIVLEQLGYPVKAVAEFRKVIEKYARSDLADDSQLEIGKALLGMGKAEEARKELLKVPTEYPNSPLADDALYLVGQSYEQQGERLASVTAQEVRTALFVGGQKAAFQEYQRANVAQEGKLAERRKELRGKGASDQLAQDEAYNAVRFSGMANPNIEQTVRQAEVKAETESALQVANRQDRINEAYRQAVGMYAKVAADYPLGNTTNESLERMARIYETQFKDRKAAMETYQRIVQLFPGTPIAENAAWKVAQFHEQQGKYDLAVNAYRDFIRTYPASAHVADAQYALAEALEQLGRWVEAMDAYQTFRDKFTSHPKATKAIEQIQWIKAYRK